MDKKRTIILSSTAFLIIAIIISLTFFSGKNENKPKDVFFEKAIKRIQKIDSYRQNIETKTIISGRNLFVSGEYDVNWGLNQFKSFSTTTLIVPDTEQKEVFTTKNISINNDIYIKTKNEDWIHFKADSIPKNYQNIAVHGPVMDNLRIFHKNGKFITIKEGPSSNNLNDYNCAKYTLSLSDKAFQKEGRQILGILLERIGRDGIINIWFEKTTQAIKQIEIINEPYRSTTKISDINIVSEIQNPLYNKNNEKNN